MAAFEITHFARNSANTTGTVWVERTNRVYTFLAFPNGNVMLACGIRPVPANHLRDVRHFVSKRFAPAPAAPPLMASQQCQQQQADASRVASAADSTPCNLSRRYGSHARVVPLPRGDNTARLPDQAALWARMPLPFTPAGAWHLLSPATQAEIGAAVIGMALADYVSGDMHAEEDHFHDDVLRGDCRSARDEILSGLDDRLWSLFPDLYGPDDDHPAWALNSGMASPAT